MVIRLVDEYQLRKDIDNLKAQVDNIDLSTYAKSSDTQILLNKFDNDLDTLDSDLTEFHGTLISLRGNLIEFNQELIDFDEDNTNLANDLTKLKDNLHRFINATNNFSTHLSDLDDTINQFDTDVFGENGLDSQLQNLATVIGDNNSGLVKGLNDLDSNLTQLDNDVFGNNGLDSQLSNLAVVVGDNNSGLVKGLNDLDNSLTQLDIDTTGLSTRLTTVEGNLSTVTTGLTSTDSDLKKLVYSLDKLSGYLTDFEGSLEDLQDELEDDPNIDTSKLNENMVALFGAISEVKSNVSTVETDMYGNGTSELPAEGSLLADMSTAKTNIGSAQTAIGNVKTDLYGSNQNPNSPQTGSVKSNLNTLKNDTVPAVQTALYGNGTASNPSSDSTMGKINTVKSDLYGNGTASNPQTGSLKNNLNTLKDTTVPEVQTALYGNGTASNPAENSTMGKINTVKSDLYGNGTASNPQSGSLKSNINVVQDDINNPETGLKVITQDVVDTIGEVGQAGTVLDDIDKSLTDVDNLQKTMYKGTNGTGTINNPATGSLMGDVDTALTQMGDPSDTTAGTIFGDIHVVKGDIDDVQSDIGTVTGSDLQTQINDITESIIANNKTRQVLWIVGDNQTSYLYYAWESYMVNFGNVDIDNIHYAYQPATNTAWVREGDTWNTYSVNDLVNKVEFVGGVTYDINIAYASTVDSNMDFDYMYSIRQDSFYVKSNGSWVRTSSVFYYVKELVYGFVDWDTYSNLGVSQKDQHTINTAIDTVLGELLSDTGWVSFPFSSNATDYSTSYRAYIRKTYNTVVIQGMCKLSTSVSASGSVKIGTLASDYIPSVNVLTTWTGNNTQGYIVIDTNGDVTFYNRNGSSTSMGSGSYFIFNCSYII